MSEIDVGAHDGFSDDDIDVLTGDEGAALIQQFFDKLEKEALENGLERDHHERVAYVHQLFADLEKEQQLFDELEKEDLENGLERDHHERVAYVQQLCADREKEDLEREHQERVVDERTEQYEFGWDLRSWFSSSRILVDIADRDC